MRKNILVIINLLCVLNASSGELVRICADSDGQIRKILPFYRDPKLCMGLEDPAILDLKAFDEESLVVQDVAIEKNLNEKEIEIARLRSLPKMFIPIKNASLHSAIKLCAEAANMNYVAPRKNDFEEVVTLKVEANPYEILEMFEEHHNLGMEYERGMWKFYRVNENELITCRYQLKYNNREIVRKTPPTLNKSIESSARAAFNTSSGSGTEVFAIDTDTIVRDIQEILELPTTGLSAVLEGGGSVGSFNEISKPTINGVGEQQSAPKGKVIYISDTNELMIVATRQQNSYIQSYLETVDKPQKLIKIAAKFVETSRDPKTEMGIDWSGVSGAKLSLSKAVEDLTTGTWPATALLSAKDMQLQFNLIKTDFRSTIIQDPQVVTTNNRRVSLKSVVQQPIESANNNQLTGGTSNNTSTIDYLEIGTIIDVFPQIMAGSIAGYEGESVQLNISIVISSIVGEKEIRGNPYPVVSSRTYDYSVIIPTGYTLAIGGLSESNYTTSETGIPLLGELPFIGYAFKNKRDKKIHRNLIAYITPTILEPKSKEIQLAKY